MLRMNGFVEKTRDWKLPEIDFDDPVSVQTGWREWVRHESAKRFVISLRAHRSGVLKSSSGLSGFATSTTAATPSTSTSLRPSTLSNSPSVYPLRMVYGPRRTPPNGRLSLTHPPPMETRKSGSAATTSKRSITILCRTTPATSRAHSISRPSAISS